MTPHLQPFWIERGDARLLAAYDCALEAPHTGVLMCAPLLHEYVRSYRLFAVLGRALAKRGYGVLRFDYQGCGDSSGDDDAFSLTSAKADAAAALEALRERAGAVPLIVLGIRGGSFVAWSLAATAALEALWLWQPITDGASYVTELRRHDHAERNSRLRYQFGTPAADAADANTLMGFPLAANLLDELTAERIESRSDISPRITVADAEDRQVSFAEARRIVVPSALGSWVEEVEMGHFPPPLIERMAAAFAEEQGR
ncbi:MAG TPA: alpha/beta fold hydrolase [Dokdonella sp.]|uniref:alpha/beta fold hydrolase n=1 Tax=Dokdonella sp. TaxID=2291710 RepID=UPI002D81168E|nr:alpha/beta fold hydrolase [Dokdonella sp.]HET9032645.1 alpha/beta fold hydrolase [Dokdonella sp.]